MYVLYALGLTACDENVTVSPRETRTEHVTVETHLLLLIAWQDGELH